MSKKTCLFFGTIAITVASASSAFGQTANGIALNRYQPSERGSDWFVTD